MNADGGSEVDSRNCWPEMSVRGLLELDTFFKRGAYRISTSVPRSFVSC